MQSVKHLLKVKENLDWSRRLLIFALSLIKNAKQKTIRKPSTSGSTFTSSTAKVVGGFVFCKFSQ